DERREREAAALDATRDRFAEPHPDPQETHPSLEE
ncbi:MAG: thioredoxin reductase, partial [Halorubrum sp.]